ncbi:hypothetical protein GCM10017673_38950 [Streptosporangium violaceochromogenes]|nr:hypothetical protein GCM10017673_38950 [Streptosporangium violaceochromogenes]
MFPPNVPVAERLGTHFSRHGAVITLDRLRDLLRRRDVHTTLTYTGQVPRLHVLARLVIWADDRGDTVYWGTPTGRNADPTPEGHGDAKDPNGDLDRALKDVAKRITEHLTP